MDIGSNKVIANSYRANGRLYAGKPCLLSHNASHPTRYDKPNTYLDVVKCSGTWRDPDNPLTLDADGWITAMTGGVTKILMHGADFYVPGEYTIEYDGTAGIEIQDHVLTPTAGSKDNNYTFTLIPNEPGLVMWVGFVGGGSVSNLRCYLTADKAALDGGQVFKQSFIDFFVGNHSIRFMDMMGTNGSPNRHTVVSDTGETQVKNMSPESIASLANDTGCIPWVCIPVLATNAYITEFLTRLKAALNPGGKVKIEFGNETWNSFGVAFREAFIRMMNYTMPLQEASYDSVTGIFTQVAHGHITATELNAHNTVEHQGVMPFSAGGALFVINLTADTFKVAADSTLAASGTALTVPAELVTLLYSLRDPVHTPIEDFTKVQENTSIASLNAWAIADGIFGRSNVIHALCGQNANAGRTATLMGVAGISAEIDNFNVAPYTHYQYDVAGNSIDWYSETNAQLIQRLKDEYPILKDRIQEHRQYLTGVPMGAYEAGNEDPWDLTALEEIRVEEIWFSPEALTFIPSYGEMLSQAGLEDVALFISHGGSYGTQWGLDRPDSPKYISALPYWSAGFSRGIG